MQLKQRLGVAFLPLVLVIGGILVSVAVATAVLTFSNINSNQSTRAASEALFVAKAGASDGIMRVVYNKNYSSSCYSIPVGSRTAYVVVTKDQPATGNTQVYSKAIISNRTRTFYSLLGVDATTGVVNLISTQEVTTAVACP